MRRACLDNFSTPSNITKSQLISNKQWCFIMAFAEQFFEVYISVLESTKYMSGGVWGVENGRVHR